MTNRCTMLTVVAALLMAGQVSGQPQGLKATFGPGVAGSAGGVASGDGLIRQDVDVDEFPGAVCGDGTRAAFYVRRHADPKYRNRWVLYLQGGGGCFGGQECADRWRSRNTAFGAQKMSNDFAPAEGIADRGIQRRNDGVLPDNRFADWNHVFLYYCSSDAWTGTASNVLVSAEDPANPGTQVDYVIHFKGASVLEAVIGTLRREAGLVRYRDPREGRVRIMPDLDAASHVLLTGGSAGGQGVAHQADWLFEHLVELNRRCRVARRRGRPCPLVFAAVPDSIYGPALWNPDISFSPVAPICNSMGPCSYESIHRARGDIYADLWGARIDRSCVSHHESTQDVWRCSDPIHQLVHHLNVPTFVRMDLQDEKLKAGFLEAGLLYQGAAVGPGTAGDALFGRLVHDQLDQFGFAYSEESIAGFGHLDVPGIFGPQCGDHETLRNNSGFLRQTVPDETGAPQTTNDTLANWLEGRWPARVLRPFSVPGQLGFCP